MKSTGIVRKVDELGRIVIPMEVRRTMEILERDPMEIFIDDGDKIILQKYEGSTDSPRALIRELLSSSDVTDIINPDLLKRMKLEANKAV